ncbi:hypothetical protein [Microbacterium album]|uniref:Uncharacterized protein n=1 Tax=Microbacterium album TaxID=2053191 RepID=A0A917IIB4_9MICO|nr:hypothetical protein [Microbacterium album]GGH51250.1 hypothetical protein GCM10010921_30560 [Microbacterium album]
MRSTQFLLNLQSLDASADLDYAPAALSTYSLTCPQLSTHSLTC